MTKAMLRFLTAILCICLISPAAFGVAVVTQTDLSALPKLTQASYLYASNPGWNTYIGSNLYWIENEAKTYYPPTANDVFEQTIRDGLSAFKGLKPSTSKPVISSHEFLLWDGDGNRHVYGLGADGCLVMDGKAYALSADRAKTIKNLHSELISKTKDGFTHAYPRWLVWMTPSKVKEVIFHSPTRGAIKLTDDPEIRELILRQATRDVAKSGDITYKPGTVDFSGKDVFHLEIRFDNKIVYNIYAKNAKDYRGYYYVESSDMDYGCAYVMRMTAIDGPVNYIIASFEQIADAKSINELMNPTT
jgi:hypothetical protein